LLALAKKRDDNAASYAFGPGFPLLAGSSERERKKGYLLVFQGQQSTLAKVQRGPKTNLPTIVRSIGYVFVLFATH
jgi:hypothetical protein